MTKAWLILFTLLCATSAFGENCRFTTSGVWGPVGTYSGTVFGSPCSLTADDVVTIDPGVITEIGQDVTQTTTGGVVVAAGGELKHQVAATRYTLTLGSAGLTCNGACTIEGSALTLSPTPSTSSSLSTLSYFYMGNYMGCGAGPNCARAQIQWPTATYDTAAGAAVIDTGIGESLAAIAAGDIAGFWNPSGSSTYAPRDDVAMYPVAVGASATTVELTVRLAANQPVPNAHQDIITGTTSSDATLGTRTVTVPSGTFSATTRFGAVGKSLRFQVGGAYEPYSYVIQDVADGGGGVDTITILDTRGFASTYASGVTFSVDYGWKRGDPMYFFRPARITCATAFACRIIFSGDTTVEFAHFENIQSLEVGGTNYRPLLWQDVLVDETNEGTAAGSLFRMEDVPNGTNIVLNRAVFIGGDASTDAAGQTEHCFISVNSGTWTVTGTNILCRFHGDDTFATATGTDVTFDMTNAISQWAATMGDSNNLVDGSVGKLTFRGRDIFCTDCNGDDTLGDATPISSETIFNLEFDLADIATKTRIDIDGLFLLGIKGMIGSSRFGFGNPSAVGLPNENVSLKNIMVVGGGVWDIDAGGWGDNAAFPMMENAVIREVNTPLNQSLYNASITQDATYWKNVMFVGNTNSATPNTNVLNVGGTVASLTPASMWDNVAFVDNISTHGSPQGLVNLGTGGTPNVTAGTTLNNFGCINTPNFASSTLSYQRCLNVLDTTPDYDLEGLLITGLVRTSAIGVVPSSAAAITDIVDRDRWCFFNNTLDFSTITSDNLGEGSARGLPMPGLDDLRDYVGSVPGSFSSLYGCGPNTRAGITAFRRMHSRYTLQPENLGTVLSGGGGGGGAGAGAF